MRTLAKFGKPQRIRAPALADGDGVHMPQGAMRGDLDRRANLQSRKCAMEVVGAAREQNSDQGPLRASLDRGGR
jgi:hypothetical protein